MNEFGKPLDLDQTHFSLRDPNEVWAELIALTKQPDHKLACEATEEEVREFLGAHLHHLDGHDVCLSIAGTKESVAWSAYSSFNLCICLDCLIGDQSKVFTEFIVVGLREERYYSVQQEEYFTGIYTSSLWSLR